MHFYKAKGPFIPFWTLSNPVIGTRHKKAQDNKSLHETHSWMQNKHISVRSPIITDMHSKMSPGAPWQHQRGTIVTTRTEMTKNWWPKIAKGTVETEDTIWKREIVLSMYHAMVLCNILPWERQRGSGNVCRIQCHQWMGFSLRARLLIYTVYSIPHWHNKVWSDQRGRGFFYKHTLRRHVDTSQMWVFRQIDLSSMSPWAGHCLRYISQSNCHFRHWPWKAVATHMM